MMATLTKGQKRARWHRSVKVLNAMRAVDPTRTTTLRRAFVVQMRKRWTEHQRDIRISIVDRDCFGIQPEVTGFAGGFIRGAAPTRPKQFSFTRTQDKVQGFMDWLAEQEQLGILEVTFQHGVRQGDFAPWSNTYIQSAYQQGIIRGRQELKKAGYSVPAIEAQPGGVRSVFNQPFHSERAALLFTRTFEDLKTVTNVTNTAVRRELIDGLTTSLTRGIAEGLHPRTIARNIMKAVNGKVNVIGKHRATLIARTEIIRAHHLANIQEYRQMERDMKVEIRAELLTAGDARVCAICEGLMATTSRNPISIDEVEGMIPIHPQCRCVAVPVRKRRKKKAATPVAPTTRVPGQPEGYVPPESPSYAPKETLEEAEAWFGDLRRGELLYSSPKRGWGSKLPDAERLPWLNEINAEVARLQDTYGIKVPPTHEWFVTGGAKGRATIASTRQANTKITFPQSFDRAAIDRVAEWERAHDGRQWISSSVREFEENRDKMVWTGGIRHEIGHRVDGQLGVTKNFDFYHMQRQLREDHNFRASNISDYARKDNEEWFAEAFARYTSPNYVRDGRFPKPLEDYLDTILEALRP